MAQVMLGIILIFFLFNFNLTYINIIGQQNNFKPLNYTGNIMNYCEIKDFNGNIYTGGCYDTLFIPSKVYSGYTIYLTGERIENGIIYNWDYGNFGDACYSGDEIQGEIIDCGVN